MERKVLLDKLDTAAPALSSSDLIPVMTHFWFYVDHVVTYNDIISIRVPLSIGFRGAVPGNLLLSLLRNSRAKKITFSEDENKLDIKAASAKISLVTMSPDEFLFEFPALPKNGLVISNEFLDAVRYCLMSVGSDTSIPEQLGVTLIPDENGLWFYSANHVTLSRSFCKVKKLNLKRQVILPTEFCKQLLRLAKPGKAKLVFSKTEQTILCNLGGNVGIFGRLVESPTPSDFHGIVDYHLPKKYFSGMVSVPTKLKLVLERATIMSSSGADMLPVSVTVKDAKARFVSSAPDRGRITDSIVLESKHPDCSVSFDPVLMKKGYGEFDKMLFTDDCVVMEKGNHLYLISPTG